MTTELPDPTTQRRPRSWHAIVASVVIVLVAVATLRVMGRSWWCECATPHLFVASIWSAHNSQHLLDPYTFSHVQHGLLFYALLTVVAPRLPQAYRLLIAVTIECGWEVLENTNWVINRYRESTASLEYYGDSIVNSVADIGAFALGYGIAAAVPVVASVVGFVTIEVVMILCIRDSLLLNVLMLFRPIEVIRQWQLGG